MILRIAMVAPALLAVGYAQTPKMEFEVASIRVNPPRTGFHFADTSGGAPDVSNPGMFRCTGCTLATLIRKAFDLQNYQFPGRASLGTDTFDVTARIPAGAAPGDVPAMLQSLLKDRFGLTYHYTEKPLRGYHLVVAKTGPKLKESVDGAQPQTGGAGQHGFGQGQGQGHAHNGLVSFGGSAMYRADHQTTADLAQLISDQLGLPVDDQTNLKGKYDIALNWSSNLGQSGGNHPEGALGGGAGHGDHGPAGATGAGPRRGDESAPTLFQALQTQLGLRLVQSEQAVARIFVVDHAEHTPTAN